MQQVAYILTGTLIVPMIAKVTIDIDTAAPLTTIMMTILAPETILKKKKYI